MILNAIAEDIAFKLGDQFNMTLRESIKQTLIYYRAKYIRDDFSRNNELATDYFQTLILSLEPVNKLEDLKIDLSCTITDGICQTSIYNQKYTILKSKTKLPKTVRLKGFNKSPYKYIGSIDRMLRFVFSEPVDLELKKHLPYRKGDTVYFFIADNYLYLLNNLNICNVLIEAVFTDPREVFKLCNNESFIDDNEFPIAEDLLVSIVDSIVNKTYPLVNLEEKVVNIQKDDTSKNNV